MNNIGIVGGRDFKDKPLFAKELRKIWKSQKFSAVVSGGAEGADRFAEMWARHKKIPLIVHRPTDPSKKRDYILRNEKIAEDSSLLVAFWDGISKGTKSTISFAEKKGIPAVIVKYGPALGRPLRVKIQRKGGEVVRDCDIWIGRRCTMGGWNLVHSFWANPYKISEMTREESLKKYEEHARQKLWVRLGELSGKTLGCFCKETDNCHGDVLVRLWTERFE
ncbi:Rossmann-fold nucleotide-binding protein [Cannes 8 virus]|nr:Rossmann-fold nucleotide-binding protein [Cannes 8 virus]